MGASRWTRALLLGMGASLSLACVDAKGSYEDFADRRSKNVPEGGLETDAGPCTPPAPGELSGPVFLAVSLDLNPKLPFTYIGTVETPAQPDGNAGLVLNLTALSYWDRKTPVSSRVDTRGPYAIGNDGAFSAALPEETFPGEANPITKGEATAQVTLNGSICGNSTFQCGTVIAQVKTLGLGQRAGTFTLTILPDSDAFPPDPLFYDCQKDVADAPPAR